MPEQETQQGNDEVGTCHICDRHFSSQEDLSHHLIDAHDGENLEASRPVVGEAEEGGA